MTVPTTDHDKGHACVLTSTVHIIEVKVSNPRILENELPNNFFK